VRLAYLLWLSCTYFAYGKEKVLSIGLTFSLGVAISYFFYGIFVAHIFKYIASIRIIVGIAAILLAVPRMVYTLKGEELKLTPRPSGP